MVINEPAEPSASVLVLGSKLYPRMLNKDVSRFMQSVPRFLLTGWLFLSLTCDISYILEWLLTCSINTLVRFEQDADGFENHQQQGSFLHEHAWPLNKRCAWRLATGSAFIKMARLKAIVEIIFLVGLGECARDLTKCVVCKKNCNMVLTKAK